jgi:hypothetical protein
MSRDEQVYSMLHLVASWLAGREEGLGCIIHTHWNPLPLDSIATGVIDEIDLFVDHYAKLGREIEETERLTEIAWPLWFAVVQP